jgi:hypothetical protein
MLNKTVYGYSFPGRDNQKFLIPLSFDKLFEIAQGTLYLHVFNLEKFRHFLVVFHIFGTIPHGMDETVV